MSKNNNQKPPVDNPPADPTQTPPDVNANLGNHNLEKAVEVLAEQVEVLSSGLDEVKSALSEIKKSGSVAIAKPQSNEPIKLPVYNLDGERWQCRFPSFYVGKDKMTAEQLANDEATLRALMADKPNLFVKL